MLDRIFTTPLTLAAAQAVVVSLLALGVMLLARTRQVHLGKETGIALVRGILQIVFVGLILLPLLKRPPLWGVLLQAGMVVGAASIAARRTKAIQGSFLIALQAIAFGSIIVVGLMTLAGVIELKVASMVPVGSMVIAGAMNACALAMERFRSEVTAHTGQIETALALGAAPGPTVTPYIQRTVEASLIPTLNALQSLGIVWIPGLMAGMLLAGADPIYAAIYQFVVLGMIYASAGLTTLATMMLVQKRVFSHADQLLLRPA